MNSYEVAIVGNAGETCFIRPRPFRPYTDTKPKEG